MSKAAPPKDAVPKILQKIQDSLADMRNMQVDMRRDIRELKASNARILGMLGEVVKASATVDERFNALEERIERLEDRLSH
jgi:predicted nuclease with TOPRIM domain